MPIGYSSRSREQEYDPYDYSNPLMWLDIPGGYFRGLLAGKPGETVRGAELAQTEQDSMGELAVEILTDPTDLIAGPLTAGIGSILGLAGITGKAARAAKLAKAAEHLTPDDAARKLASLYGAELGTEAATELSPEQLELIVSSLMSGRGEQQMTMPVGRLYDEVQTNVTSSEARDLGIPISQEISGPLAGLSPDQYSELAGLGLGTEDAIQSQLMLRSLLDNERQAIRGQLGGAGEAEHLVEDQLSSWFSGAAPGESGTPLDFLSPDQLQVAIDDRSFKMQAAIAQEGATDIAGGAVGDATFISGWQTGPDQDGLRIAKAEGQNTAGTAPPEFKVEGGADKVEAERHGITEITAEQKEMFWSRSKEIGGNDLFFKETDVGLHYVQRTWANVYDSDVTLWFGEADTAGGSATQKAAAIEGKPFIANPTPEQWAGWVSRNRPRTINIAGNRARVGAPNTRTINREGKISKDFHVFDDQIIAEKPDTFFDNGGTTIQRLNSSGLRTASTGPRALGEVGDVIVFNDSPAQYLIQKNTLVVEQSLKDPDWLAQTRKKLGYRETPVVGHYVTDYKRLAKTTEVHFKAQLNKILTTDWTSNLVFNVDEIGKVTFKTVEGAYQAFKTGEYREGFEHLTGPQARTLGEKLGGKENFNVLQEVMEANFDARDDFKKALSEAGVIEYTVERSKEWSANYPKVMDNVRRAKGVEVPVQPIPHHDFDIEAVIKAGIAAQREVAILNPIPGGMSGWQLNPLRPGQALEVAGQGGGRIGQMDIGPRQVSEGLLGQSYSAGSEVDIWQSATGAFHPPQFPNRQIDDLPDARAAVLGGSALTPGLGGKWRLIKDPGGNYRLTQVPDRWPGPGRKVDTDKGANQSMAEAKRDRDRGWADTEGSVSPDQRHDFYEDSQFSSPPTKEIGTDASPHTTLPKRFKKIETSINQSILHESQVTEYQYLVDELDRHTASKYGSNADPSRKDVEVFEEAVKNLVYGSGADPKITTPIISALEKGRKFGRQPKTYGASEPWAKQIADETSWFEDTEFLSTLTSQEYVALEEHLAGLEAKHSLLNLTRGSGEAQLPGRQMTLFDNLAKVEPALGGDAAQALKNSNKGELLELRDALTRGEKTRLTKPSALSKSPEMVEWVNLRQTFLESLDDRIEELGGARMEVPEEWGYPTSKSSQVGGTGIVLLRTLKDIKRKADEFGPGYPAKLSPNEQRVVASYMGVDPEAIGNAVIASGPAYQAQMAQPADVLATWVTSMPGSPYMSKKLVINSGGAYEGAMRQLGIMAGGANGYSVEMLHSATNSFKEQIRYLAPQQLKQVRQVAEGLGDPASTATNMVDRQLESMVSSPPLATTLGELGFSTVQRKDGHSLIVQKATTGDLTKMPMAQSSDEFMARTILIEAARQGSSSVILPIDALVDKGGIEALVEHISEIYDIKAVPFDMPSIAQTLEVPAVLAQQSPLLAAAAQVRSPGSTPQELSTFLQKLKHSRVDSADSEVLLKVVERAQRGPDPASATDIRNILLHGNEASLEAGAHTPELPQYAPRVAEEASEEQMLLDLVSSAPATDVAQAPKIYHGTRHNNPESFIDENGNLVLKSSENFEGKQVGVSFSESRETALDYSTRVPDAGPARSRAQGAVFEIDADAIPAGSLFAESGEELATRGTAPVVIPKGKFRIIKDVAAKGELEKWEAQQVQRVRDLPDPTLGKDFEANIRSNEIAENSRSSEDPVGRATKGLSQDIEAKYGDVSPGNFPLWDEILERVARSNDPEATITQISRGISHPPKGPTYFSREEFANDIRQELPDIGTKAAPVGRSIEDVESELLRARDQFEAERANLQEGIAGDDELGLTAQGEAEAVHNLQSLQGTIDELSAELGNLKMGEAPQIERGRPRAALPGTPYSEFRQDNRRVTSKQDVEGIADIMERGDAQALQEAIAGIAGEMSPEEIANWIMNKGGPEELLETVGGERLTNAIARENTYGIEGLIKVEGPGSWVDKTQQGKIDFGELESELERIQRGSEGGASTPTRQDIQWDELVDDFLQAHTSSVGRDIDLREMVGAVQEARATGSAEELIANLDKGLSDKESAAFKLLLGEAELAEKQRPRLPPGMDIPEPGKDLPYAIREQHAMSDPVSFKTDVSEKELLLKRLSSGETSNSLDLLGLLFTGESEIGAKKYPRWEIPKKIPDGGIASDPLSEDLFAHLQKRIPHPTGEAISPEAERLATNRQASTEYETRNRPLDKLRKQVKDKIKPSQWSKQPADTRWRGIESFIGSMADTSETMVARRAAFREGLTVSEQKGLDALADFLTGASGKQKAIEFKLSDKVRKKALEMGLGLAGLLMTFGLVKEEVTGRRQMA